MDKDGTVIALGMFDGVHMGHRRLLDRAISIAQREHLIPMVYTFSNHPSSVFSVPPKYLLTREESLKRINNAGVNSIVMDDFTEALCRTEPKAFVDMLISRFSMKAAVVGLNYTFGKGGGASSGDLQELGCKKGFTVDVIPDVIYDGELVSSTGIRKLVEQGCIERANNMLGIPYSIEGFVVHGKRIGHTLGFPTANIDTQTLKNHVFPKNGVYATITHIDDDDTSRYSITNVGTNPTVGGTKLAIETHIFDFSESLYNKRIRIDFLHYIRGQMRFCDAAALAAQINSDIITVKEYFAQSGVKEYGVC